METYFNTGKINIVQLNNTHKNMKVYIKMNHLVHRQLFAIKKLEVNPNLVHS